LLIYLGRDPGASALEGIESLTSRAVAKWTSLNPGAMANWLKENPEIPNYDMLTGPFAVSVAKQDYEAARAWAGSLRDPAMRDQVLKRIAPAAGR
jgi:hypothetical protein